MLNTLDRFFVSAVVFTVSIIAMGIAAHYAIGFTFSPVINALGGTQ